jgi:hypothetical protein
LSDVLALLACDGAGPPPDEEATQHVHQDAHHAGSVIEDLFFSRTTFETAATAHLSRRQHLPAELRRAQATMESAARRGDFAENRRSGVSECV